MVVARSLAVAVRNLAPHLDFLGSHEDRLGPGSVDVVGIGPAEALVGSRQIVAGSGRDQVVGHGIGFVVAELEVVVAVVGLVGLTAS